MCKSGKLAVPAPHRCAGSEKVAAGTESDLGRLINLPRTEFMESALGRLINLPRGDFMKSALGRLINLPRADFANSALAG